MTRGREPDRVGTITAAEIQHPQRTRAESRDRLVEDMSHYVVPDPRPRCREVLVPGREVTVEYIGIGRHIVSLPRGPAVD